MLLPLETFLLSEVPLFYLLGEKNNIRKFIPRLIEIITIKSPNFFRLYIRKLLSENEEINACYSEGKFSKERKQKKK